MAAVGQVAVPGMDESSRRTGLRGFRALTADRFTSLQYYCRSYNTPVPSGWRPPCVAHSSPHDYGHLISPKQLWSNLHSPLYLMTQTDNISKHLSLSLQHRGEAQPHRDAAYRGHDVHPGYGYLLTTSLSVFRRDQFQWICVCAFADELFLFANTCLKNIPSGRV